MKKVLLIGDSIRHGYDNYVKESMQNVAEVCAPKGNCMFTTYILRYAHTWVEELHANDADLVHWNAGLWDTLSIYGDKPLLSLECYADNVERIIKRLKFLCPKANIVFATSTPCIEDGFIKEFESRTNSDIEKYNAAAIEICRKHNVIINDLYSLLKDNHTELHSDQTHYYTADGTEIIGGAVNKIICATIGIDEGLLITPDKQKYECKKGLSDKEIYIKRGDFYEAVLGI